MRLKFRIMIAALLAIQLAWYFIPWGFAYPGDSKLALYWLGKYAMLDVKIIGLWGGLITAMQIIFNFGMFFFKDWARRGFFVVCIISGVVIPFCGISVQSAYEGALGYFIVLGHGVVLSASFSAGVREFFDE